MPTLCAVYNCGNNAARDKEKRFFRIPKIIKNGDKTDEELSTERRALWFKNINRKDLTEEKAKYTRVCGDHFISGASTTLRDRTNPDWAPTLKLGYDFKTKTHVAIPRSNRMNERSAKKARLEVAQTLASLDTQGEQCWSTLPGTMADQVESDLRGDGKETNASYPLRKWWRPYWLSTQGLGGTHLQDPADPCCGMDLTGWSSGRPWPECTSSPLIVPLHPASVYGGPWAERAERAEQYKWKVVLDVAHFTPSEIWIGTAAGVLEIRGTHTEKRDEHGSIARSFTRKYRLPEGIDLSRITSTLSPEGFMYVEAPLTGFTAPAEIVIPIQVEAEVAEPRRGEEVPAGPSAPGEPGREGAEPPAEEADRGEASLAGAEASGGQPPQHDVGAPEEEKEVKEEELKMQEEEVKEQDQEVKEEEVKEQEAPGGASEESSSAAGPGEGPDVPPEPREHVPAPGGGLEREEAGDAAPEPQPGESSGEAAVEAPQTEEPAEGQSP